MKKFGFTLAELVVTLSIIGIVSALVAPTISDLMPDKNKAKVLKYHALVNNAVSEILADERYQPYTKINGTDTELACTGFECVTLAGDDIAEVIKAKLGISDDGILNGSRWEILDPNNLLDDLVEKRIRIDLNLNNDSSTDYNVAINGVDIKKIDTIVFWLTKEDSIQAGDPLTDAYLQNPYKMNDRKKDFAKAKELRRNLSCYRYGNNCPD